MVIIFSIISQLTISWSSSSNHIKTCPTKTITTIKTCKITFKRGPTGEKGPTGDSGPRGLEGLKGVQGEAGTAGSKGPQGDMGPEGPVGPQGETGVLVKGPVGATGDAGKSANEVICYCQDEIYAYFCCLIDNKDSTTACNDKRTAVKTCEDKCFVTTDVETECATNKTACDAQCDTQGLVTGNLGTCISGAGLFTTDALVITKCKEGCTQLEKLCKVNIGCIREQENRCIAKCPEEAGTPAKLSCATNCQFAKNETDYKTTCDCLFPAFNPYQLYSMKVAEVGGAGAIGNYVLSTNTADGADFSTDVSAAVLSQEFLLIKADVGYSVITCSPTIAAGNAAIGVYLNASALVANNVSTGIEINEFFCFQKKVGGTCYYLSYFNGDTTETTQNGFFLDVSPTTDNLTIQQTTKACWEFISTQ